MQVWAVFILKNYQIWYYLGMMVENSVKHKLKSMDQRYHFPDKSVWIETNFSLANSIMSSRIQLLLLPEDRQHHPRKRNNY